jgi:hypothetical protein
VKGESTQPVQVRSKEVSVRLGSYPGDGEGDRAVEAPGTEVLSLPETLRAGKGLVMACDRRRQQAAPEPGTRDARRLKDDWGPVWTHRGRTT